MALRRLFFIVAILVLTSPLLRALPESGLDLGSMVQPVPAGAVFSDPAWDIWCGAPIKGDDGKYHLFYSRWPSKFGFAPGWCLHSEIAHAVADTPFGPYHFVNVALPARGINPATGQKFWDGDVTHNPNILRVNGRYYLFYMGNHGNGTYADHRNNQRVGVAVADKPEGPWQRFDQPIIDVSPDPGAFDSLCTTNPAVTLRPDGSILLLYKGVTQQKGQLMGGKVRYGAATASHPEGPYQKVPGRTFEPAGGTDPRMLVEDAYIWYSTTQTKYYALARDAVGRFTGDPGALAMFQSADGITWQPTPRPKVLGSRFIWANGQRSWGRVERPALLFDGETPIALFGATNGYAKLPMTSCNVQIPLLPLPEGK